MKICVIGAGPGALTTSALLSQAGHQVHMWNRTSQNLRQVVDSTVELFGALEVGPVAVQVEEDLGAGVSDADLIIVVVPASGHREIARAVADVAHPGVPLVVIPGRTGGALEVRSVLGEGTAVVEAQTLPFGCRIAEQGRVRLFATKARIPLAGLGVGEYRETIDEALAFLPGEHPWEPTTLVTSLANVGAVIHPAFMLSDGTIGDFARLAEELDAERCALAQAYEVEHFTLLQWLGDMYAAPQTRLEEALEFHPIWGRFPKPATMDHRYLTEDLPTGLVPMIDMADVVGLEMRASRDAVEQGSRLLGRDFFATGRTLQRLGVEPRRESVLAAFAGR